jgi:hypothetical protein
LLAAGAEPPVPPAPVVGAEVIGLLELELQASTPRLVQIARVTNLVMLLSLSFFEARVLSRREDQVDSLENKGSRAIAWTAPP